MIQIPVQLHDKNDLETPSFIHWKTNFRVFDLAIHREYPQEGIILPNKLQSHCGLQPLGQVHYLSPTLEWPALLQAAAEDT